VGQQFELETAALKGFAKDVDGIAAPLGDAEKLAANPLTATKLPWSLELEASQRIAGQQYSMLATGFRKTTTWMTDFAYEVNNRFTTHQLQLSDAIRTEQIRGAVGAAGERVRQRPPPPADGAHPPGTAP
jgi:hypothetical protein